MGFELSPEANGVFFPSRNREDGTDVATKDLDRERNDSADECHGEGVDLIPVQSVDGLLDRKSAGRGAGQRGRHDADARHLTEPDAGPYREYTGFAATTRANPGEACDGRRLRSKLPGQLDGFVDG